jgi:hypothetical protein
MEKKRVIEGLPSTVGGAETGGWAHHRLKAWLAATRDRHGSIGCGERILATTFMRVFVIAVISGEPREHARIPKIFHQFFTSKVR